MVHSEKIRGTLACEIAGIDKQRFNEAVSAGNFSCAPKVRKGGTRTFTEEDIIALFVYARLTEQEWPPRVAGSIACEVRSKLETSPDMAEIRIPRRSETSRTPLLDGFSEAIEYEAHVHMLFDIAGIRTAISLALRNARDGARRPDRGNQHG